MSVEATLLARIRNAPAWQPPRPGARYTWDCGCTFLYTLAGAWEPRTTCAWHAARASGSERSVAAGEHRETSKPEVGI